MEETVKSKEKASSCGDVDSGTTESCGTRSGTTPAGTTPEKESAAGMLSENELYLKTIFNFVQTGLVVLNADTHEIIDVNPRAVDMIGAAREQIIGAVCHQFICPAQKGKCPITDLGMRVDNSERIMLTAKGVRVPIIKSVIPITINNRHYLLESIFDISNLKAAEAEIQKKTDELARSNLELQQFAYIASHDLQEPLRAISGFTELLAKRYQGQLDERADKYISFITEGSLRMQQMIQDLLSYSRVQTQAHEFAKTDSKAALDRALGNLRVAIQKSNASITNDPLPEIIAEGDQIALVFQNLIGNAIKYQRPQVTPVIHISAQKGEKDWLFSVADNGIGIDEKYADRLFKIFQRLHTRDEYPGTGIGLAICKRIIERHGGTIWLKSRPGEGTTFYFTIPLAKEETKA
ncbi:MAG: ATP-binding protein [Methanoregula sp.]|uniref:sensor histidine kinase n=1 Tax=Methanoregula sp. TaxID=2052170 RepID=UPI003C43594A